MGYYVYRYTDKTDNIIKYVGIVYGKTRELAKRINEHKKDSWHKNGIVSSFKLSFYSINAYKLFLEYLNKFNESTMTNFSLELNFPKWLKEQDVHETMEDFLSIHKSLAVLDPHSYYGVGLFSRMSFCKGENEQWIFRIKQTEYLNSIILDLKEKCEQYELWETINLKTLNQVKMYERCKQYNLSKNRAYSNLKLISKLSPVNQEKGEIIYFSETP